MGISEGTSRISSRVRGYDTTGGVSDLSIFRGLGREITQAIREGMGGAHVTATIAPTDAAQAASQNASAGARPAPGR
jgi:hypothetical protein